MYWKRVKLKSIQARLAVFYSLASLGLLALVVFSSYLIMIEVLHATDKQYLSDEIDAIAYILENDPDDMKALNQEVDKFSVVSKNPAYRYYARVLNEHNVMMTETDEGHQFFEECPYFKKDLKSLNPKFHWWHAKDGKQYLLTQTRLQEAGTQKTWTIQAALDVSYQNSKIRANQTAIIFIFLAGLLAAVVLAIFIAKHGLKRLRDLTRATQKITASSLSQRINPSNWAEELQDLAGAFNHMLARIETAFTRLTQLSADLAHELRTPINNLIGESEVLLTSKPSDAEYRQGLESHLEELTRISHILEDLLFLSRAENPQIEIQKESLQLEHEIQIVIEYYQSALDEKGIQVQTSGSGRLLANKTMLRRLLANLLSNSLKYTPFNGSIFITLAAAEPNAISLSVRDTGIGIAPEHLPSIFQRFYRTDAARSQDSGGVGLGLSIVKSIVELHKGEIQLTSELGQGVLVRILFPL